MRKKVTVVLCLLLVATATAVGQTPASKKPPMPAPRKKLPPVQTTVTVSAGLDPKVLEKERLAKKLLENADQTFARKEYEQALEEYLTVTKPIEEMGDDGLSLLQHALERSADCYRELGRFADAEATYLRTIQVLTNWGGPFESSIGHRYLDLAELQMRQKNLGQSERYLRKAVETYDLGIEHFKDSDISHNIAGSNVTGLFYLGVICRNEGKPEEALQAWERAFTLWEKFRIKPERMLGIVRVATDLLNQLGRTTERDAWMKRYERIQAQAPKPTP